MCSLHSEECRPCVSCSEGKESISNSYAFGGGKGEERFCGKGNGSNYKEKEELENELKLCKERLVSQQRSCAMQLKDSKKKLRSAQNMLSHSRKKCGDGTVDMVKLCKDIDKVVSWHFPGKHAPLKAKVVVDALCSGLLFQGEGVEFLNELKRRYVRDVFKDWKVLKAFLCSAIGAFKTSTV
jgi:hypothetical protein